MTDHCSDCDKPLSFGDSFVFEGKSVCKSCLMKSSLKELNKSKEPQVSGHLQQNTRILPVGADHISSMRFYLGMLFGGLGAILLWALAVTEGEDPGSIIIFVLVGVIALIVAAIYSCVLLYQIWRFVINESRRNGLLPSIKTPGQATGYCFIPLYNLYWNFLAFGKFPKDFNALARSKNSSNMMSEGLGTAIAVLSLPIIIPFIGLIPAAFVVFILHPIFFSQATRLCKEMSQISIVQVS